MKKIFSAILVATVLLTSCLEGEQSSSGLTMYYPSYGYNLLMADQTLDSICFLTTESGYLQTDSNWLKIDSVRKTFTNPEPHAGLYVDWNIPVNFEPNLSGAPRFGSVKIYAGPYVAGGYYAQTRCLGVTRPTRYYKRNTMMDSTAVLTDSALACVDSIAFTMYSDWNLSVEDATWLNASKTSGGKGIQIVKLQFTENKSSMSRNNHIYIQSVKGINDTIPVMQLGTVFQ